MLFKTTLFIAFVAISKLSVAAAPGCLLGAINGYNSPSNIKAVCQSKDAQTTIQKFCGSATTNALSAFADVCNKAGVKVSALALTTGSVSTTATATATTVMAKASGAGVAASTFGTSTAVSGNVEAAASGAATLTGTAAVAQSTGAAGKLEVGAAALFAGFGLLAAAL